MATTCDVAPRIQGDMVMFRVTLAALMVIGAAAAALLAPACAWITGQRIEASGGQML